MTGVGIGSVTTLLLVKPMLGDRPMPPPDLASVEMRKPPVAEVMLERMDRVLSLTPDQRTAIAAELRRTSAAFASLHEGTRAQLHEILEQADGAMKAHLTPEQRELFDERIAKHRLGNRIHGGPGPEWRHREGRRMGPEEREGAGWERRREERTRSDSPDPVPAPES